MDTSVLAPALRRRYRKHSPEFKARVIAACLQPGVSIAAVALANQLNANFLRSWVNAYRDRQRTGVPANVIGKGSESVDVCRTPRLVPVSLRGDDPQSSGAIRIEIHRQETIIQMVWPASQAGAIAQCLREILR